jgi:hypothetical protein
VGRVLMGQSWRPVYNPDEVGRELRIIRDDLHCTAVRICGEDLDRITDAAGRALELGLEVWLAPERWDATPEDTLAYVGEAAQRAEPLLSAYPGRVVFSVGSELTLFMRGIGPGDTFMQRMRHRDFWPMVQAGAHNGPLNDFLARAVEATRRVFHGPVTYASVPLEAVEWDRFDIVSVDLYREARNAELFPYLPRRYKDTGRPLVITETGCCTYRGAAAAGAQAWDIVDLDPAQLPTTPPRLKAEYVRDEGEQARELTEVVRILDQAGVDGVFVMTFVAPLSPYSDDPWHDLDMPCYSLVRSFATRLGNVDAYFPAEHWDRGLVGTTYPGLPWEPKQSFYALAALYGVQA